MYKQPYNTPSGYRMCSPWSLKNLGTCLTLRNRHTPCILHVFLSVAENSGDSWQPASSPPLRQHQTDLLSLTWLGALGCFPIWPLVSIDCIALGQATNHFNYVLIASWMHCHSSSSGFTKMSQGQGDYIHCRLMLFYHSWILTAAVRISYHHCYKDWPLLPTKALSFSGWPGCFPEMPKVSASFFSPLLIFGSLPSGSFFLSIF